MDVTVSPAKFSHHKAILQLSRTSPFTKKLGEINFIQDYYEKREMIGAYVNRSVAGFALFKHLKQKPFTSLYYLGVSPHAKRKGVCKSLLEFVQFFSPHPTIRLLSEKANAPAFQFYQAQGFTVTGEGMNKSGIEHWEMERTLDETTLKAQTEV